MLLAMIERAVPWLYGQLTIKNNPFLSGWSHHRTISASLVWYILVYPSHAGYKVKLLKKKASYCMLNDVSCSSNLWTVTTLSSTPPAIYFFSHVMIGNEYSILSKCCFQALTYLLLISDSSSWIHDRIVHQSRSPSWLDVSVQL